MSVLVGRVPNSIRWSLPSLPCILAAIGVVTLGGACDDVPIGPEAAEVPDGPVPTNPTLCDVAARLTAPHCTGCHGGSTAPLLTADGLRAAIDAPSTRYPGKTLIVPGDAQASLLFAKLNGPAADEGARMPLGGSVDAELIAMVGTWIDAGAPTECDASSVDDGGETGGEVGTITPGAPIEVGDPPPGFASTAPSFADGTRCSTGQWWQHRGDNEAGSRMNPGRACISCHQDSGEDDAPLFAFAGTVMGDLRDDNLCRGVEGVTVQILDSDDVAVAQTTTNAAGNFFLRNPEVRPFRVRLLYQGRTREMLGHQDAVGDCMACHTAEGQSGAPGRVVAP